MRKSYISLILSGVLVSLCAGNAAEDTIIANFGNKNSNGGNQGTWDQAIKHTGDVADYGTDWSGSDVNLGINASDLIFVFGKGGNSEKKSTYSKLLFKDGFTFSNNLKYAGTHEQQSAAVTIQWSPDSKSTATLIFGGDGTDSNSKITIDNSLAVHVEGFQNVEVKRKLLLEEKSSLMLEKNITLKNQSGIIMQKDSKIQATTLENDDTVAMLEGSSLWVGSLEGKSKIGKLDIQGDAQIFGDQTQNFTIKNQTIEVWDGRNLSIISQPKEPRERDLDVKITLGDSGKALNLNGKGKNSEVIFERFNTLESKNLALSHITLRTGASLKTLKNTSLELNGGHIFFGDVVGTGSVVILSADTSGSTFTLKGFDNLITAGNQDLQIKGTHTFKGGGTLDILGKNIILGESSVPLEVNGALMLKGENSSVLALGAKENIKIENLKLENLKLQTLGNEKASIANKALELGKDSVIEAVDRDNKLIDLVIVKNESNGSGTIAVSNGATSTLRGKNISITDNNISLKDTKDTKTALVLEALEGSVNLGGSGDETPFKIEGKNTTLNNNVLDLKTSMVNFGKKVELSQLSIIAGDDNGITFYGTQGGEIEFKNGTTITTGRESGNSVTYKEMIFSTQFAQTAGAQNKLKFGEDTTLKASSITIQSQEVILGSSPMKKSGEVSLRLYALGSDGKADNGAFAFVNTKFSLANAQVSTNVQNSNAEIALYANKEAVLMANGLTLDGINLSSYRSDIVHPTFPETPVKFLNALDLSASSGKLIALGSVSIIANGIYTSHTKTNKEGKETTEKVQGIGMDIYVGDSTKTGTLTIKSDVKSEEFVIGGNLVLDHSSSKSAAMTTGASNNQSKLIIELGTSGNGGQAKLDDQTLGLDIVGGIKVIHNDTASVNGMMSGTGSANTTEIKAKNFKFGEISSLHSINGTLKLNTKEDSEIEIKGKVILEGTNSAEAKLEVVKTNGNAAGIGAQSGTEVKLKLHDIQAKGKASISNKGITFMDSHISASAQGEAKSFIITDTTVPLQEILPPTSPSMVPDNLMSGTIASITLDGADLEFKRGTNGTSRTQGTAGIHLNANGVIKSIGDSKLTTKTIKVGKEDKDRFSLDVSNGTFTLIEEVTKNKIGDILLDGGNFVFLKSNGNSKELKAENYHSLKLQGNLTSKGNSSISVASLEITQKKSEENKNYSISSTDGELRFNLMAEQSQELKNDFKLENGGIGFYDSNSQGMGKISLKESTISSSGNSFIKASELDLGGANISASGGTLQILGVKTNTLAGNLSVGNAGVVEVKNYIGSNATLRIQEGKMVKLSATTPYISPSEPLGGGQFGKVVAKSLVFEGDSGESKLVNVAVSNSKGSQALSLKNDSLFALREGKVVLIETDDGIFKKSKNIQTNITLEDVSVDKGGYISIALTPEFEKGKDWLGQDIVKKLALNISVSQTTTAELMESIKDPQNKQTMEQIFSNPLNGLIVDSILQSSDNVFKVGMAEYIASGNVEIVDSTLRYMTLAFQGVSEGIYASDKIQQELKMLRTSSLENRMARSGNPYVSKVEIASLLKAVSGTRYASEDDGILLDGEYSGPNYGSLWASYEGATSFGTLESASVNGLSAGYDTLVGDLKEYLLGFYVNYGYGTYGSKFVKNDSHNFGLGFYSRMTFGNNEVDLILSQSIGINRSDLDLGASGALAVQYLNQNFKYNFYLTDAQVRYGYLIAVGNEESPFYFKPFGGVDFGFSINGEARGEGVASIGMDQAMHFKLDVVLGLEMKKYFNEGSYIYLVPMLEKGLFNDGNVVNLGFVGANKIPFGQVYQVDTAVGLYAGGQGSVGKNVSITGGLGIKMDIEKKDVLTNWNVGFKYKF